MSITTDYLASIVQFDPRHPSSPTVSINVLGCNMRQIYLKDFRGQAYAHELSVAGVPFPVTKGMTVGMPDPAQQHWLHVFKQTMQNVALSSIIVSQALKQGLLSVAAFLTIRGAIRFVQVLASTA